MREHGRDLRRAKRVRRRNAAWIGVSRGAHIPCVMWDVSDTGARLAAPRSNFLPQVFNLAETRNGDARRLCRVVWRNDAQVGVQFISRADADEALESVATRQQCKAVPTSVQTSTLMLPGYGPQFVENPDRRGIRLSLFAAGMLFALVTATLLLVAAGVQSGADAPWAMALCSDVGNFCQHPEWTGVGGALMTVVYLAARGMEA